MVEDKYMKPAGIGHVNPLYDSGVNSFSLERYEELLVEHLKEVKTAVDVFKKNHPKSFNHKIVIVVESGGYDELDNQCYISGKEEMSKAEKIIFDEGEKYKADRTDQFEKQQLANLLKKYPNYKP